MKNEHRQQVKEAIEQYQQPLVRYAQNLLRNADKARDVVQETFLRLCDQPDIAAEPRLAPWLYRVCRTRAIDQIRKENRTPAPGSCPGSSPSDDGTSIETPFQAVETADDKARMLNLLAALPDNQRETIRLKFQSGLTYKQIADVTGLTATNVGYLIHTGLKTIRSQMTPA